MPHVLKRGRIRCVFLFENPLEQHVHYKRVVYCCVGVCVCESVCVCACVKEGEIGRDRRRGEKKRACKRENVCVCVRVCDTQKELTGKKISGGAHPHKHTIT